MYRKEVCQYIKCSITKLWKLEKSGALNGTFYNVGNRRIYVKKKLDEWIAAGGETDAKRHTIFSA